MPSEQSCLNRAPLGATTGCRVAESSEPKPDHSDSPPPAEGTSPALIATDLTGDLPCVGCGYNLKGLSIRGICSECGTPVRATILAHVDPMAEQLQTLNRPRITAGGLILWSSGAVVAAVLVWVARLAGLGEELFGFTPTPGLRDLMGTLRLVGIGGLVASMLGAIAIVRPTPGLQVWECVKAVGAILAYLPLIYIHDRIHRGYDVDFGPPFVGPDLLAVDRSYLRLAEGALIIVIILGLRANAVSLAERSLVMRLGRVDTQPLIALVWTMGLAMLGDLIVIIAGNGAGTVKGMTETLALVVIAVGSFLFTLGLFGVLFDTVRLRPILLEPAPGLTDIFRDDP